MPQCRPIRTNSNRKCQKRDNRSQVWRVAREASRKFHFNLLLRYGCEMTVSELLPMLPECAESAGLGPVMVCGLVPPSAGVTTTLQVEMPPPAIVNTHDDAG